ncbi:MAG: hypothetical protein AB2747_05385 [Candidatus Thiodiazotropha taylori]
MKMFFTLLLFITSVAIADPQIDLQDGGTCHIPANQTNAGDEIKMPCSKYAYIREDGAGGAEGVIRIKVENAVAGIFPGLEVTDVADIEINKRGKGGTLYFDSTSGVPCNLVNEDGTNYQSNDWEASIRVTGYDDETFKAKVFVICRNAQAN